jgi:hypothetical protein
LKMNTRLMKCIRTLKVLAIAIAIAGVVFWKKLSLNGAKWKSISFNRNKKPIGGHELEHFERIKDLGVIMDTRMSYLSYVETIISKSARIFGFIKCISRSNVAYLCLLILFNAIVYTLPSTFTH